LLEEFLVKQSRYCEPQFLAILHQAQGRDAYCRALPGTWHERRVALQIASQIGGNKCVHGVFDERHGG
jgi:hypothetical protein